MSRVLPLLAALVLALLPALPARAAPVTVPVGAQFTDTSGNLLHAHGGGVVKAGSYYYWFGENRNADGTFRYVSAYRSTDLRTWEFRNHVLTQSSATELQVANIERPKVIFNPATGQYVMWMHKENGRDYGEARAAVAVSNTVDGNYTYLRSFRPLGHMSRDITAFVDTDGTGYMISAADENYDLHVYRLSADFTDVATLARMWDGDHREAPAMFKRNGVYFLLTSGATGWQPNQAKYATATSITGTWSAWQNAGDGLTFGSQPAYVLPVQGTSGTSYLYLGDRWAGAWGGPVNDSRYVWLPIQFSGNTGMSLTYARQVTIDAAAGTIASTGSGYDRLTVRHSGKCADVRNASGDNLMAVIQYTCGGGTNQQWRIQSISGGHVQIIARHSAKCLDVNGVSTADGAALQQYGCGTGTNQQWTLQDAGGGYLRLVARHSGKCADLPSSSTANDVQFKQYPCGGGQNQQFTRTPL
ncbi:Ricin-type beta-trefoil lectin domain-like [Nonomuraea solani]|uniref:Ricin-type beta-trefoil lectin domain-like n=1 Tax=Nonomuraea solani TaxID=1144553 RepID=A0A1H6EPW0_9ACTN|nr:RICIN domain-containing protein [Nonomuraea solani]SEG99908.1 Ricin-type beta-trefoil lectin domain-like [Nonomuraea solani]